MWSDERILAFNHSEFVEYRVFKTQPAVIREYHTTVGYSVLVADDNKLREVAFLDSFTKAVDYAILHYGVTN